MRDYALGTTFDLKFTTRSFTTGAPTTLAGTPVISAYPDNNTTELTAGITLTADFDSRTGMNNVRVVATGGNGYASGSNYALVITTGTVGGVSVVGEVIGEFSLEAQSPLRPTTAGLTLDVSATGEAGVDWANVGGKTTVNALTNTTIATSQVVASVTGAVGSVTGLTASNLDTTVSSRLASASYTTPPTAIANADALLDRDMSTGTDSGSTTVRTARQALRAIRNKTTFAASTLTVTKEDDSTTSWTAAVSTDVAALPIVGIDPAGP